MIFLERPCLSGKRRERAPNASIQLFENIVFVCPLFPSLSWCSSRTLEGMSWMYQVPQYCFPLLPVTFFMQHFCLNFQILMWLATKKTHWKTWQTFTSEHEKRQLFIVIFPHPIAPAIILICKRHINDGWWYGFNERYLRCVEASTESFARNVENCETTVIIFCQVASFAIFYFDFCFHRDKNGINCNVRVFVIGCKKGWICLVARHAQNFEINLPDEKCCRQKIMLDLNMGIVESLIVKTRRCDWKKKTAVSLHNRLLLSGRPQEVKIREWINTTTWWANLSALISFHLVHDHSRAFVVVVETHMSVSSESRSLDFIDFFRQRKWSLALGLAA